MAATRGDYSNGSRRFGTSFRAVFRAAVSFPPASAKSGLPPPEPPTCFGECLYQLASMDFSSEVLGYTGDQGYFVTIRHTQDDYAGAQLLAKGINQLAQAIAVDVFDFADYRFHALNGLGLGKERIQLVQRTLSFLGAQVLLQLFGRLATVFPRWPAGRPRARSAWTANSRRVCAWCW